MECSLSYSSGNWGDSKKQPRNMAARFLYHPTCICESLTCVSESSTLVIQSATSVAESSTLVGQSSIWVCESVTRAIQTLTCAIQTSTRVAESLTCARTSPVWVPQRLHGPSRRLDNPCWTDNNRYLVPLYAPLKPHTVTGYHEHREIAAHRIRT